MDPPQLVQSKYDKVQPIDQGSGLKDVDIDLLFADLDCTQ